jgi:tetratricopeptide (TPR) repeat protein
LREKVLGKEHPGTLTSIHNIALFLQSQGKYDEAEPMYRQTLALTEKILGKEHLRHASTLTSMNNLAFLLQSQGKYDEAEPMYRQTLALREKILGKEHPDTLTSMNTLAGLLQSYPTHIPVTKIDHNFMPI